MSLTERVNAAIDGALGSRIVGCEILFRLDGKEVFARAAGYSDREAGRVVNAGDIYRLASCTKPIVAATALVMLDRGLLSLDDPVTR